MKTCSFLFLLFVSHALCCQLPATKKGVASSDTSYVYKKPSSGGTGKFYMGREIAGIMDASGANWLEREGRPLQENTEAAIDSMLFPADAVVADVGAGSGYYTFRIASRVKKGKVYAVEIQDEFIRMLNEKKKETNAHHVEVIKGDTLSTNLPHNSFDAVLMVDVYHELAWPKEILLSISYALRENGKPILMEYRGEDPSLRIKPLHKTTVKQLSRELDANGFSLERRVDVLPMQHLLIFRKKPDQHRQISSR